MLMGARRIGVPLLIGSAGTAGGDAHVETPTGHGALETLQGKRDRNPQKKHGNIPL